ncbi:hypothetical protein [Phenylobacterium sp.]|jgi:nitroreductase|uniref:hypothetical protein n=1 Tax=Phenylobacterium sp. TaxID=1871053 RepID=UPI002F92F683
MTPVLLRELVAAARFSPNVHNVQPTRWRLEPDGAVSVLDAADRRLPAGDPTGRDALASHGAAVEGFALAASLHGLAVDVDHPPDAVARLTVRPGAEPDPLAAFLTTRRTWRGGFRPTPPPAALAGLMLVTDPGRIAHLARLNDAASLRSFRRRDFRAELLAWMRLSRRHPDWSRDGLNAEAMSMSPLAAAGAAVALRPGVFEALDRLGLGPALAGEAAVVRSACALGVLTAARDEPPFAMGRRWHRAWLEITRLGLAAAPMTVLGDDPQAAAEVAQLIGLPPHERVVTVMRMGVPDGEPAAPARLPVDELIV